MNKTKVIKALNELLKEDESLKYALATNLAKYGRPQSKKSDKPAKLTKGLEKGREKYVKDGDKVKKVSFGSGGLRTKINNPEARRAFAARHNCDKKKDRTKAGYWSCNLPRYAKALGLGANKNTYW